MNSLPLPDQDLDLSRLASVPPFCRDSHPCRSGFWPSLQSHELQCFHAILENLEHRAVGVCLWRQRHAGSVSGGDFYLSICLVRCAAGLKAALDGMVRNRGLDVLVSQRALFEAAL